MHHSSRPTHRPMRLRTRFSHKASPLHRPISPCCGSRGKPGSHSPSQRLIFLIPSFAPPRFRKLYPYATRSIKTLSPCFPLFLADYGYYCLFFNLSYPFGTPVASRVSLTQNRPPHPSAHSARQALCLSRQVPGIQTTDPVFHAHVNPEVNTIKKKERLAFPGSGKLL